MQYSTHRKFLQSLVHGSHADTDEDAYSPDESSQEFNDGGSSRNIKAAEMIERGPGGTKLHLKAES